MEPAKYSLFYFPSTREPSERVPLASVWTNDDQSAVLDRWIRNGLIREIGEYFLLREIRSTEDLVLFKVEVKEIVPPPPPRLTFEFK